MQEQKHISAKHAAIRLMRVPHPDRRITCDKIQAALILFCLRVDNGRAISDTVAF